MHNVDIQHYADGYTGLSCRSHWIAWEFFRDNSLSSVWTEIDYFKPKKVVDCRGRERNATPDDIHGQRKLLPVMLELMAELEVNENNISVEMIDNTLKKHGKKLHFEEYGSRGYWELRDLEIS
jgi:hypothetical protein